MKVLLRFGIESGCLAFAGETFLEDFHQVNDLAFVAIGFLDFDNVFVLFTLLFDQLHELRSLFVFQLFQRKSFVRMFGDESFEFFHGGSRDPRFLREVNFLRQANLV